MYIYPAIDLYGGNVVRLLRGDYEQMTVYSDDPLAVARTFRDAGAEYIHTVDLAGARDGAPAAFDLVAAIVSQTGLKVEVGGEAREDFCQRLQDAGVGTLICTDISRDGAMRGANRELYRDLAARFSMDIIASGGVSTLEDITALRALGLHGAILGRAYYTGAVKLTEAIEVAK